MSLFPSCARGLCPASANNSPCANVFRLLLTSLFCCGALLFSPVILAQDNVGDDSTVVYPASYFTEFRPVTALDMINRIPGMNVSGGGGGGNASRGGRGLGAGSGGLQVLLNGKRTAGKNNNTSAQLGRITADQVEYIEIIRGTGGELDVRGSTQIANIVMFETQSSSTISYEINADYYHDREYQPGGSLSYSGQSGDLNYIINASAEPRYDHNVAFEQSVLADFSPNDLIAEDRIRDQTSYEFSTNLDYRFSDNLTARINALYAENDNPTTVQRLTTDLAAVDDPVYAQREDIPGERSNWELGGDVEYQFNNGARFKLLAIANEDDTASTRERFNLFDDGSQTKTLFLDNSNVITENIVRASYTTDLFVDQDVEFGVEAARTVLDSGLLLGMQSSTGIPSDSHGGLVPVDVPNAFTTVEEMRYEPFAIHNWQLNPRMSLETSLVYEYSEIQQQGDFNQTRDFTFFKPKFDYRFDVTPQIQLRMLVEKSVRQINFVDFVAVTDTSDEDSNTLAGNNNLRPDYWWNYNLNAEYRLPDDIGVVSANIYKHHHKDFRQRIDVSTGDQLASAVGNIGSGDMWVLDVRTSTRMKFISLPNLLVTTRTSVRTSEVNDPFLGIDRSFDNFERGRFEFGFRHDIPRWRMNYGLNFNNRFDGNLTRYDIEDLETDVGDPFVTAFVEVFALNNTSFRFDMRNLSDGVQCRERYRYQGHIRDQILEEYEKRCNGSGRVLTFRVSGTF
jgi:hypothetical protein